LLSGTFCLRPPYLLQSNNMVKSLYAAISAGVALLSTSGSQAFTASPPIIAKRGNGGSENSRHINHQLYSQNNNNNVGSRGPSLEFLQKMGVKEPIDIERVRVSIISVEEALQMYRDAKTAEERERLLVPLREKMMEAAMGTRNGDTADSNNGSSAVAPLVSAPTSVAPQTEAKQIAVPKEEETPNINNKPLNEVAPTTPIPGDIASLDDVSLQLSTAAMRLDAQTVSTLLQLNPGVHMDEETTDSAFRAVVIAVDRAEARDEPIPPSVPQMLHHIFDADLQHLLTREKITKNVTCMMPQTEGLTTHGLNYVFDDGEHKNLPLEEGRRCEGGNCCDKCSRNIFPTFAQENEIDFDTFPGLNTLTFNDLEKVPAATILQFMRLIERVRRTMAHEYGLDLKTLLPLQAYSRKYVAGMTQKGGGGGEGDFVTLHVSYSMCG